MSDPDFLRALTAERFGPPVPRAQKRDRINAAALAELLADLDPSDDEEVAS